MKPVHLRAKYPLEQYVVGFEFPGLLTTQPLVTVETEVGRDDNPQSVAGWLFTTGNVVCVLVAGGQPGCVYKILCEAPIDGVEYSRAGLMAVKPSVAIPPPGFVNPGTPELPTPTLPFARAVSSPVYPGQFIDEVSFLFEPVSGEIVTIYKLSDMAPDEIVFSFIPVDGELFEAAPPVLDPDEIEFTFVPVAGDCSDPKRGDIDPDEVEFTFIPVAGNCQTIPVGTISQDEVEFTFIPVGGTLG